MTRYLRESKLLFKVAGYADAAQARGELDTPAGERHGLSTHDGSSSTESSHGAQPNICRPLPCH